ncbi:hypothetical protein C2845_PM13G06800 [Panicum miliaceum]|uniref:MATH domain-containing protein n=1 Tax=Panicum miliaceum TaxID=4540 RepID=A0A3L6RH60_PANMI|nr:hypothetical protein C2845_PM13G06800 [Panicum miliaceum]
MGHDKDKFVRSGTFSIGGHSWSIRFYPDGYGKENGHISVYLELMKEGAKVRASCDLRPEPDQPEHWVAIFGAQDRAEDVQLQ